MRNFFFYSSLRKAIFLQYENILLPKISLHA